MQNKQIITKAKGRVEGISIHSGGPEGDYIELTVDIYTKLLLAPSALFTSWQIAEMNGYDIELLDGHFYLCGDYGKHTIGTQTRDGFIHLSRNWQYAMKWCNKPPPELIKSSRRLLDMD